MPSQLEADLREALAHHASSVPTGAVDRLLAVDYGARSARLSGRVRIGAAAGTAATVATIVSVVTFAGATPAFAGWSAKPTAGTRAQLAAADSSCASLLAELPNSPSGTWAPVTTDVRGPYTLGVYENSGEDGTCITGPSIERASLIGGNASANTMRISSGVSGGPSVGEASSESFFLNGSGPLSNVGVDHLSSSAGAYSLSEGQVASGVTGVTLVLSDGTQVETTVGGGYFLAWWPGSDEVTSAELTQASGTTTEPFPTAGSPVPVSIPSPTGSATAP